MAANILITGGKFRHVMFEISCLIENVLLIYGYSMVCCSERLSIYSNISLLLEDQKDQSGSKKLFGLLWGKLSAGVSWMNKQVGNYIPGTQRAKLRIVTCWSKGRISRMVLDESIDCFYFFVLNSFVKEIWLVEHGTALKYVACPFQLCIYLYLNDIFYHSRFFLWCLLFGTKGFSNDLN